MDEKILSVEPQEPFDAWSLTPEEVLLIEAARILRKLYPDDHSHSHRRPVPPEVGEWLERYEALPDICEKRPPDTYSIQG